MSCFRGCTPTRNYCRLKTWAQWWIRALNLVTMCLFAIFFCNFGPKICAVAIMICRAQSEPGFIFNIAADLSELYWEGLYALLQAALGGHHHHHRGGHHQHHHQHQHLSAEEWILVHSCKIHEEKVITARSLCTGLDFFAHQSPWEESINIFLHSARSI